MSHKVEQVTLPACWASALVNGDYSGLDDAEASRCKVWQDNNPEYRIVDCAEESRFTWSYDLYDPDAGVIGGEVLEYTALVVPEEN